MWRKLRKALNLIKRGIPPSRALSLANLPANLPDNQKAARLISRAEASFLSDTADTVYSAATGNGTQVVEGNWLDADDTDAPRGVSVGSRAPSRVRAWSKKDYKAATWLLERRFPSEYGSQQPAQVAETVVNVLAALAQLRQQPASLDSLRHRPALEAGEQQAGTPGTP